MSGDDSQHLILSPLGLAGSGHHQQGLQSNCGEMESQEVISVTTNTAVLKVARQGRQGGPVILTFHDLGLNHVTNYKALFSSSEMELVLSHFCVYHINAPGQEPGADLMSEEEVFPDMEELSQSVEYICHHFGISSCVGIGCGLGANVLIRLAKRRSKFLEGLVLFNTDNQSAGWLEWTRNLVNIKSLAHSESLSESVVDYLLTYHFGSGASERRPRLVQSYREYFRSLPARNIAKLMSSFNSRSSLKLARDIAANGKTILGANRTLKMPVLNMVGEFSPHVDQTVNFNGRLDPEKCTWMKINDASLVVVEQVDKVAQSIVLFLQGLGYTLRKPLR